MITRRNLIVTGSASAVIGGLATVGCAHGPSLTRAREPWSHAGQSFGDPRLDALAYAILAPNPHNRQPWMFELVGNNQIDVYCDLEKRLEQTDPFDRQITIGFGCMLELLRMAGAGRGYTVTITPFPDGAPQPRLNAGRMASVRFERDEAVMVDPLFSNVLERRSTKDAFDMDRPVDRRMLDVVISGANSKLDIGGTIDDAKIKRITDLAWLAWMIEYETPRTRRESIDLMRIGNRAVAQKPDGISLGGLSMGLMKMTGIVSKTALDTPGSKAYETGIDMYRDIVHSAMGFAWVKADGNTRASQIEAGQAWVRMNLAAQQAGLCIHPMSQALEEFPEMAEPYRGIHTELGAGEGGVVHMLGRLGYTKFPKAAPRWPLESKLISS